MNGRDHGGRLTMGQLLAALHAGISFDQPADVVVTRLLTLDGNLPYDHAVAALTFREQAIVSRILGRPALRLSPAGRPPASTEVVLSQSPQGRLCLGAAARAQQPPLALLDLPAHVHEQIDEQVTDWQIAEDGELAQLDAMLRRWALAKLLPEKVDAVVDWVNHVETVLIYIGSEVFSRSDAGTDTLRRDDRLRTLRTRAPDTWTAAERLFVAAAHLLFTAGRSIRFEEFNGRQLSATALRAWLVGRWRRYAHATGVPLPDDLAGRPMETLAAGVAVLSRAVDGSDWIRFRRIRGTAFTKNEVLRHLPRPDRTPAGLPPPVRRYAERVAGHVPRAGVPAEDAVAEIVAVITAQPDRAAALTAGLLASIVRAAVIDLDADYAMSSAVRDAGRLAPTVGGPLEEILRLRKPDFFCCVLPHPRLERDEALGRVLWMVAQRMQFNRWHFAPGNFGPAEVPRQRHYFFPPALPDIAESSDLWHGGHVAAGVRHSLRAPGAPLWRDPLTVGGNEHRGCYDIRAVRTEDRPFGTADLFTAIRYSALVDRMWRAVADSPSRGHAIPVVTSFDRDWYERRAWLAPPDDPGHEPTAIRLPPRVPVP